MPNRLPDSPSYGDMLDLFGDSEGDVTKRFIRQAMNARDRIPNGAAELNEVLEALRDYTRNIALYSGAAIAELESRVISLENNSK